MPFFVAAWSASAQGALTGPSLGVFFDANVQALRSLQGIPGSAAGGRIVDLGFPIAKAALSPNQNFVFAVQPDGLVKLALLGPGGVTAQITTDLPAWPDRIAVSPMGRAAAFAYGTSIEILIGLPNSLGRVEEVDASALPSAPTGLAISDDGGAVLVSTGNSDTSSGGGVFVFIRGSRTPRLVTSGTASDVTFVAGSRSALIADQNTNSVAAVDDVGGTSTVRWVFEDDRLGSPNAARPTADGQLFMFVSSKSGTVALLDSDGRNAVFLQCLCAPDRIQSLSNSVYQLTDSSGGMIWIADLTGNPRLLFVPVPTLSRDLP